MHQTPGSPISPVEPVSFAPPKAKVSTQVTVGSLNERKECWLPFTFRWYFLLIPTTASLSLAITISLLVWYSQNHHGLGSDDGSSAVLFGWRFTPTLLAVLYTQLTVILFIDAKRTEPFARLAKAPTDGASATGTILQAPRAWWNVFGDVLFKRKTIGKTSWCLILCAFINVMAALVISPLSSALLTSEEVIITKPLDFNRIVPRADTQLPMVANRETYFRTISALMRNVSTSAWITDQSLTLPFWPSTGKAHFGPDLGSNYNSWATETTVLHADFACQNMTLESADLTPRSYSAYDVMDHGPYNGTEPMVSFKLASGDGCRYELTIHPAADLANSGGLTWSSTSTYLHLQGTLLPLGKMPFPAEVSSHSPYARHNASKECRSRDIIILSTPWTKVFPRTISQEPMVRFNRTYERSSDFRMKALLCESQYSLERRNVTATLSRDQEPVFAFGQDDSIERKPITNALINITDFEKTILQDNWVDYFNEESMRTDADRALGGYLDANADPNNSGASPGFSGLGALLGALYAFNITKMFDDKDFVSQAARAKGRFFTENLRETLANPVAVEAIASEGETTLIEEKILVVREIGIALAVLFLISSLLLCLVICVSRLSCRPLNLETDPGSTIGHAALLRSQLARSSTLRSKHQATRPDFHHALRSDTFYTLDGSLHSNHSSEISASDSVQSKSSWHPLVIRLRMLFALFCFLIMILVTVLVLNAFSAESRLSQLAFVYEADVSKFGLSVSTFAPISIAPTVVSIAIGLWWGELDTTFRTLQPYISMSGQPTPIRKGAGLTYRSKTWVGAAIKAARNKHWMLFMVAMGSVLCQTLTVSMSALFERRVDYVSQQIILERSLESRQTPIITTVRTARKSNRPDPELPPIKVLNQLLLNPPENWLPGAAIQLSLNGTKLAWTHDGWSFIPLDLSGILDSSFIQPVSKDSKDTIVHGTNVTVVTSALRARLECAQIPEVMNSLTWIKHPDEVLLYEPIDLEGFEDSYVFNQTMFDHTSSNTSAFATNNMIRCCSNVTNDTPETAAIGYWSPVDASEFPFVDNQWPLPFVTKWIVGKPRTLTYGWDSQGQLLYFEEIPELQAARCIPVVETAEASIVVDKDTGMVQSYEITDSVKEAQSAWSDVFVRHELTNDDATQQFNESYDGPLNMTTSYGILFMGSMFKAADPNLDSPILTEWESLRDNAFVMRDKEHGLNMDLMTYSMYSLANKDPRALLNYETLVKHADHTFETFFQHFVSNGLSLKEGGLAYQKIGDNSTDALGMPVSWNGTALPQRIYPKANANRTVEASVSNRIRILHMNSVATYLSVAILIWLIGTAAIITILQRKYTSGIIRDVQLIADVLVLVAGSDNLLELIHEQGVELKKDDEVKTMLGWFKDRDGEIRWGVEVVGGRDAVEWVDAPKTGSHVQEKSSSGGVALLPWRMN